MDARFCTECGERVTENAKFCAACGTNVGGVSLAPTVSAEASGSEPCPNCGEHVVAGRAACPTCFPRFGGATADGRRPPSGGNPNQRRTTAIVVALALLLIVVGFVATRGNDDESDLTGVAGSTDAEGHAESTPEIYAYNGCEAFLDAGAAAGTRSVTPAEFRRVLSADVIPAFAQAMRGDKTFELPHGLAEGLVENGYDDVRNYLQDGYYNDLYRFCRPMVPQNPGGENGFVGD